MVITSSMSLSLGVDTSTTWAVSVPMFLWWSSACAAAYMRLEGRLWGVSLGAVRAHVARTEIAHAATLAGARSHALTRSKEEHVAAFIYKAMICFGSFLAAPIALGASSWQRRRMALTFSEIFTQLQPFVVLLMWGVAMLTVRGGLRFGLMLLTVGQATTVFLWLLGKWQSVGWSQPGLVLASAWAARAGPVAMVALALWALFFLALTPYGSIATAWVFFAAQLSIICFERVDKYAADQTLTMELFAVAKKSPDSELNDGINGHNPDGALNTDEVIPIPEQLLRPPANAFDALKKILSELSLRRLQAMIVLLVYVVWVALAAPQEGKHVGAANAVAVLVVDATFTILARCPNVAFAPGSFVVLFLEAAARASIAGGGSSQWFLGHCVVFVLLAGFVVRNSIKTRGLVWEVAHIDDELESDEDNAALRASEALRVGPSKAASSPSDITGDVTVTGDSSRLTTLSRWAKRAKKWCLKNPDLMVLMSLVIALLVEVAVVAALGDSSSSGLRPLLVGTLVIPQWSLGVLALGLVLAGAAIEATVEAERLDARTRHVSVYQAHLLVEKEVEPSAEEEEEEETTVGAANVDARVGVGAGPQAAYPDSSLKVLSSPCYGLLYVGLAWQRLGAMLAALAVIGGIVHVATGSFAILALGTCFPTAIVAARALRSHYVDRHYERFWDHPYAQPPRHRRNTFLAVEGHTSTGIASSAPASVSTSTNTIAIESAVVSSEAAAPTRPVTPGLWSSGYLLFEWSFSAQQCYRNWRAGDFRPVAFPLALVRGGLSVTDYSSFAAWCALIGALALGWEVAAAGGWRAAFVLPLCLVELLSALAGFDAWHHLLTWRAPAVLGATVLALVVHIVLHVWILALEEGSTSGFSSATEASISESDLSDNSVSTTSTTSTTSSALSTWGCIVLLSFLGWPAAALAGYAVKLLFGVQPGAATYSSRAGTSEATMNASDSSSTVQRVATASARINSSDEGWGIEASLIGVPKTSVVCLAGSGTLWLLFAILVGALYSWVAGSAIVVVLCLTAGASGLGWVWRSNRYYLPPRTRAAALSTSLALVTACCLVSAIALKGIAAFALVSLAVWGLAMGLLLAAAAEQVSATARGEHLAFSASDRSSCFPAVRHHFSNGTLCVHHRPIVWSGLGWALLMAWSFAATTLLDQPSVGLVTLASLCLVASFAGVAACTEPTKQMCRAWQFLEDERQGTLESIDPDRSLKRQPAFRRAGLSSSFPSRSSSTSPRSTAALQPPRFMQPLRQARTTALLATVPPPSSSILTLPNSERTPLDASTSEADENAAADNDAEQRWVRLAAASGCTFDRQGSSSSSNTHSSRGSSARNGFDPEGEAALWFSVALLHDAIGQATVKELRATVGASWSACASKVALLMPRTATSTVTVTEPLATRTVGEQHQQEQQQQQQQQLEQERQQDSDVTKASQPGGGDPFSLVPPSVGDQAMWPLDSAKVNDVAAALKSRLSRDLNGESSKSSSGSSSTSGNSDKRFGYRSAIEVAARDVISSGSVLWLQPVNDGRSIAGNPLARRAALHNDSSDDVEAGRSRARADILPADASNGTNADEAPRESIAPSAEAGNNAVWEEDDSAWYAVRRLQERASWAAIQRALLLAHFHRAVIAAAAEKKDDREVRFGAFVGWLRAHVPRSELGVLALPLLGPSRSSSSSPQVPPQNDTAATNAGVATDYSESSAAANDANDSLTDVMNSLSNDTTTTPVSDLNTVANDAAEANTTPGHAATNNDIVTDMADAPATTVTRVGEQLSIQEHRGVGLSDVLQWAAPHRKKVASFVARFEAWEAEKKAALEAARRDAVAAALRRAGRDRQQREKVISGAVNRRKRLHRAAVAEAAQRAEEAARTAVAAAQAEADAREAAAAATAAAEAAAVEAVAAEAKRKEEEEARAAAKAEQKRKEAEEDEARAAVEVERKRREAEKRLKTLKKARAAAKAERKRREAEKKEARAAEEAERKRREAEEEEARAAVEVERKQRDDEEEARAAAEAERKRKEEEARAAAAETERKQREAEEEEEARAAAKAERKRREAEEEEARASAEAERKRREAEERIREAQAAAEAERKKREAEEKLRAARAAAVAAAAEAERLRLQAIEDDEASDDGYDEDEDEDDDGYDDGRPFEADASLPERLRSGQADWKSASRDLGITDLCTHPASLASQTGTSRFAPEDVCQGTLGDCWLLSAMSLVALQPELLERNFASNLEATPDGNYRVQLFKQGKWRTIKLDDRFPVQPSLHHQGKPQLLFVRSVGDNELWPSLLEKAYAKYYGGYGEIEGGFVHLGLVDLTGGVGQKCTLTPGSTSRDAVPAHRLWEKLKGSLLTASKDTLVGAGSTSGRDTEATPRGIVKGHAYAILQVREIDGLQLLQLRNPWGTSAWAGPFSDDDVSSWTPRLKAALAHDPNAHRSEATGVFWMSLGDFMREFDSLYLCRLFRTVSEGGQWHKQSISSRWSKTQNTSGGYRAAPTEPQFLWRCARPAEVYATLTLDHDHRDDNDDCGGGRGGVGGHGADGDASAPPRRGPNIALFLLEAPAGGSTYCRRVTQGKVADSGPFTNLPTVSVTVPRLEVRDDGYVFIGTTFEAGNEQSFTVTVFADYPFILERLN